ncbi:hypothetical protein EYF80_001481 [Liparis tanakae]|uniref:Uncharacterized protein n=1 Tax=Liparis tanakae TaxID=230148 RepID=A0A4Z2JDA6_9TELE|nr:hypothetical protein EYF80_001481 [Liparis tanakae]
MDIYPLDQYHDRNASPLAEFLQANGPRLPPSPIQYGRPPPPTSSSIATVAVEVQTTSQLRTKRELSKTALTKEVPVALGEKSGLRLVTFHLSMMDHRPKSEVESRSRSQAESNHSPAPEKRPLLPLHPSLENNRKKSEAAYQRSLSHAKGPQCVSDGDYSETAQLNKRQ